MCKYSHQTQIGGNRRPSGAVNVAMNAFIPIQIEMKAKTGLQPRDLADKPDWNDKYPRAPTLTKQMGNQPKNKSRHHYYFCCC